MDKFIACDFCDRRFSTRNSMRSHKSKFHRNEKQSSSIESNSDSESDLDNSDKETSRDALKQFETDVESSEEESSNESGDESDDERSDKGVKTSRKILKRRMHKNSENKHIPKNLHSSKREK